MKRTPLSRGASVGPDGRKRFSTFASPGKSLSRAGGLSRSRMRKAMRKAMPKRLETRAHMRPYVEFVRALPCICCGAPGPSDAAHMPVGKRGMGLKAPDSSCVPLCRGCHLWFDGHSGRPVSRHTRRMLAVKWVEAVQIWATPETVDQARDLMQLGLGHVEGDPAGDWKWVPVSEAA